MDKVLNINYPQSKEPNSRHNHNRVDDRKATNNNKNIQRNREFQVKLKVFSFISQSPLLVTLSNEGLGLGLEVLASDHQVPGVFDEALMYKEDSEKLAALIDTVREFFLPVHT